MLTRLQLASILFILQSFVSLSLVTTTHVSHQTLVDKINNLYIETNLDNLISKYATNHLLKESVSQKQVTSSHDYSNFMELSSKVRWLSGTTEGRTDGYDSMICTICTSVMNRHKEGDPYICRGYEAEITQTACVQTMESMMWWLTNQVYWVNYGCEQTTSSGVQWVRPCPSPTICSLLKELWLRRPFCGGGQESAESQQSESG